MSNAIPPINGSGILDPTVLNPTQAAAAEKGFFSAALPFLKKAALTVGSGALTYAKGNKVAVVLGLATAALVWDKWKQLTDLDALETQELRKRFVEQRNSKLKKIADDQAPSAEPTTEEMESIGRKKTVRNVTVTLHILSVVATLTLGILACYGMVNFSIPLLFSAAAYLSLNTIFSIGLAKHFRMSKFTQEPDRSLAIYQNKNLNKPKYRSNTNNTLRYIGTFLVPFPFLPLIVKAVTFADKVEKEGNKLAAIALNN